jgi:UDP-glucose 4-epimerase
MKVLVTGGAGFIGSHLADHLIKCGHEVTVLDDLSTGRLENIRGLEGHPRFRCRIGSVTDERTVAELISDAEVVFHLAAAVGVFLVVQNPVRTIETNVLGTEILLRQAAARGRKVLLASTSEVYGKSRKVPSSENDDLVLGPTTVGRWSYACSKALEEFLAIAYWNEKKLPMVIVRPFNVVGPRQTGRYGMVLPRFVEQALGGGPITVYGNGSQTRSFAHVRDVVEALVRLAEHPAAVGQIYNVGNDQEIAIQELAHRVAALAKTGARIQYIPYEEAYGAGFEDLERRVPDLSKIREAIGYQPRTTLDEIILELLGIGRAGRAKKTEAVRSSSGTPA